MKAVLLFLVFAVPAFAQEKAVGAATAGACGAESAKFDVQTAKGQHPLGQPEAGKALVYFIEQDNAWGVGGKPTTRAGLDGAWVGATHFNSYFFFSVTPGEHHLCASWEDSGFTSKAAAHFTAEPGKVYYFRARSLAATRGVSLDLDLLDSDEGLLLVSLFPVSVSRPKK